MTSTDQVLRTVEALLSAVRTLEALYPGRSFTLDGHLVGSIGEVLAAELYGLQLLPASSERHDAVCPAGRHIQVKLTQTKRVSMYSEPEYLIVLRLREDGNVEEVYAGPGSPAWSSCGKAQKNGQRSIGVARLRQLQASVVPEERIVNRISPAWFAPSQETNASSDS